MARKSVNAILDDNALAGILDAEGGAGSGIEISIGGQKFVPKANTSTDPFQSSAINPFGSTGTQPVVDRAKAQFQTDLGRGFGIGTSLSQPTGEEDFLSAGNLAQIGTATALGFATAGPVGALTGLVTSGLGAFLNSKNEKRRAKSFRKAQANADRMQRESIARDEKWKKVNQANILRQEGFNRKQTELKNDWGIWQSMNQNLGNMVRSSQDLIDRNVALGR